jgi:hypothetical protein
LIFYIAPAKEADQLTAKLHEDYRTLNAGVYLWRLDLDETDHGWDWKRGEATVVFSLL